jgi:predicted metal-binding membrane protein
VSSEPDPTSRLLSYDRAIIAGGIAALVALSWLYLANGAGMDAGMHAMRAPPLGALVLMWWLMMLAMMLPSAAPAILLYGRVRETRGGDAMIPPTWMFLGAYLVAWLLFSIVAASAQHALIGPSMALEGRWAAAAILVAAGLYQLSPLKNACLGQCRSPAQFLSRHWRPGASGAIRLGLRHGAYCVGCCWMLMALLFVGGVMNFAWIAALTLIVGVERLLPRGEQFAQVAGVALIAWGVVRMGGY